MSTWSFRGKFTFNSDVMGGGAEWKIPIYKEVSFWARASDFPNSLLYFFYILLFKSKDEYTVVSW